VKGPKKVRAKVFNKFDAKVTVRSEKKQMMNAWVMRVGSTCRSGDHNLSPRYHVLCTLTLTDHKRDYFLLNLQAHDKLLHTRHPKRDVISTRAREYVHVNGKRELAIMICHCYSTFSTRCVSLNMDAPFVSSPSCTTTGADNVSQFSASNRGFIRRSRSSTRRR
jgi:hypothetical protein